MAIAQEKKYQRGLNKDRNKDLNININNISKYQGSPDQSIKNTGQPNLAESLREEENAQEQNIKNMSSSSVTADDQASIRRQLGQDRLQARNEKNKNGDTNDQSLTNKQRERKSIKGGWQSIKAAQQRSKNKLSRLNAKDGTDDQTKAQVEKLANETIKKLWMYGHEVVEEALIANFYLLPILGPIYLLILIFRPLFAMVGMLTIKIKGIKVKMVPGYGFNELFLRAKGGVIILFITALELAIIILLIYIYTHPWDTLVEFPWKTLKAFWELATGY